MMVLIDGYVPWLDGFTNEVPGSDQIEPVKGNFSLKPAQLAARNASIKAAWTPEKREAQRARCKAMWTPERLKRRKPKLEALWANPEFKRLHSERTKAGIRAKRAQVRATTVTPDAPDTGQI